MQQAIDIAWGLVKITGSLALAFIFAVLTVETVKAIISTIRGKDDEN